MEKAISIKTSNGGPLEFLKYEFDLSKPDATKLAELLGCQRDTSISIPKDLPSFYLKENYVEAIMIETGFGISFEPSQQRYVDRALMQLGYVLQNTHKP